MVIKANISDMFDKLLEVSVRDDTMRKQLQEIKAKLYPQDANLELVSSTCETFTRLLLSITPFKAKEFVEKNCARVTAKIKAGVIQSLLQQEDKDDE